MIATVMVYRQLEFVRTKQLGFNREHLVVLPYGPNEKPMISALLSSPNVLGASVTSRVPVNRKNRNSYPCLINQTAVSAFGWHSTEEALGKGLTRGNRTRRIVGVVEDFHLGSLHEAIRPLVL
jgi:putative ABC transport system permease protein